jgi:phosphoglycolate phosphatase
MSPLTVVFDLDGTLVDTAPDLADALNAVLAVQGMGPIPPANTRTMIGGGPRRMIEAALAFEKREFAAAAVDSLLHAFITHYSVHIADRSRPFPGVNEALDELAAQGCILAVCTNKLEALSRLLLDNLGLSARFAAICGQDTFGIQKPNPEILLRTIVKAGGVLERAVMVGDSAADIAVARAAELPVVAVDFGYTETPVRQLYPDLTISHFAELATAIRAVTEVRT